MKKVAVGESLAEIGYLRNMLEQQGIACLLKNEQLAGALGEIPFLECQPELWVLDDAQAEQARRFIHDHEQVDTPGDAWHCPSCGESNEGQFSLCWQCGGPAPNA